MNHLSWLYILLILAGCTDTSIEGISIHTDKEFYATIEGSDSRTYVDDQIRLRWTAEDRVTIFKKTTYNREFMFTGVTGANAGGFKQKSVDDDFWYGADVPYNYAVYPHSSTTQIDETDHFFTLTMPSEQTYVENSFGLGANTMVAVSESGQLMFKNVGSYLRVRLYGKDIAVSSITLASKGNESIAGKAKVTPTLNGNPTCEMLGTGKSIRLTCPEPVTISEDVDNPTDFWIVVPPVTLSKGFTVTVENEKGDTQVFEVTKPFTFERNLFTNMKREVSIENGIPNNQIWYKVASWYGKREARPYNISLFGDAIFINSELTDSVNRIGIMYFDKDITIIKSQAFHGQDHIVSITLPNTIETIERSAFSNCTGLCSVTLPENLKCISTHLLSASQISSIRIPKNVTSVEFYALNTPSLKEVHFDSTTPPTINVDAIRRGAVLYVPKGCLSAYEATWPYNLYKIIEE